MISEPLTLYRVNSQGYSANLERKSDSWDCLLEKARIGRKFRRVPTEELRGHLEGSGR